MKKRVCIIMSAVGLMAIAQTAGAKGPGTILTEPNWVSASNSSKAIITETTVSTKASDSKSMIVNADAVTASDKTTDSPDGITSTEYRRGGGGSGDGIEGKNMFGIGVGFAGGLAGADGLLATSSSGYSTSTSPGIRVDWEHGKTAHFGYGILLQYASASFSDTYTNTNYVYNSSTGLYDQVTNTYTDKWTIALITFAGRVAYHFSAGDKLDPYVGATIGYVTGTFSYSSTDPNGSSESVSATGIALGAQVGARYFFSDHIGAFAEFAYCTNYGENYANVGLSIKL